MSSEKQISRVGAPVSVSKAWRTIDVRTTSPNVPICGNPDGTYPVSNSTGRSADGLTFIFSSRLTRLRASAKGQALALAVMSSAVMVSAVILIFQIRL